MYAKLNANISRARAVFDPRCKFTMQILHSSISRAKWLCLVLEKICEPIRSFTLLWGSCCLVARPKAGKQRATRGTNQGLKNT